MGTVHRSGVVKKSNDSARLIITTIMGIVFGFFVGVSFPSFSIIKLNFPSGLLSSIDVSLGDTTKSVKTTEPLGFKPDLSGSENSSRIYVATNPRGAELLPPGIVVSESDFYLRRLWGDPNELDKMCAHTHAGSANSAEILSDNINAAVKRVM